MRALTSLADRVLVMHHGATFFEGNAARDAADERVIEVYLGARGGARAGRGSAPPLGSATSRPGTKRTVVVRGLVAHGRAAARPRS